MRLFNWFNKKNSHQVNTYEENAVNPPCSTEKRAASNSDQSTIAGQQNKLEPNASFSASHQFTDKEIDLIRLVIAHCSKLLVEAETGGRQAFAISGTGNVGVLDLNESHYPVGEWTVRISAVRNGLDGFQFPVDGQPGRGCFSDAGRSGAERDFGFCSCSVRQSGSALEGIINLVGRHISGLCTEKINHPKEDAIWKNNGNTK